MNTSSVRLELNFAHTSSSTLDVFGVSHAILGVFNSIFHTSAVSNWMYFVFYKSRCVELNYPYSFRLRVDVFHLPCLFTSDNLIFAHCCSLRLDPLRLSCHVRCIPLNFTHAYSLKLDLFFLSCHSTCDKLDFASTFR